MKKTIYIDSEMQIVISPTGEIETIQGGEFGPGKLPRAKSRVKHQLELCATRQLELREALNAVERTLEARQFYEKPPIRRE